MAGVLWLMKYSSGQNKLDVFYNAVAVARCENYSSRSVPFRAVLKNIEILIDTLCVNEIYVASPCRLKKTFCLCVNVTTNASTFLT